MGPLDDIILRGILAIDATGKVLQKEDDKIEYKEVFENGSKVAKAKYAKEMAALYNYEGGYLIFGVNDSSELVGLKNFTEPDNALLVNDINNCFSPAIRFHSKKINISGKDVFVIYVEKRNSIPTVCIKGHLDTLKEATIYWRYSAQSAPIAAGDLINLLNSLKGEDSKELAEIALKDLKSKYKPHFSPSTISHGGGTFEFTLSIINHGDLCYVTSIQLVSGDVVYLTPINRPQLVQAKGSFRIEGRTTTKHLKESVFLMMLEIKDRENFKYRLPIEVNHAKVEFHELEELN